MKNLKIHPTIFESTIMDGPMSRNKKFYDNNLDQEEIDKDFWKEESF